MISQENGRRGSSNSGGDPGAWCAPLYATGAAGRRRQPVKPEDAKPGEAWRRQGRRRVGNQPVPAAAPPGWTRPPGAGLASPSGIGLRMKGDDIEFKREKRNDWIGSQRGKKGESTPLWLARRLGSRGWGGLCRCRP